MFQALSMFLRCVQIQLPCSRSSAAEVSRSKHHGCHNYHDYHHDNKHEHNDDFWLSSWTFKFFQHMVGSPKWIQTWDCFGRKSGSCTNTWDIYVNSWKLDSKFIYPPWNQHMSPKTGLLPKRRFDDSKHPLFKGFCYRFMESVANEFGASMCLWGLEHRASTCETLHPCV